MNDYTAARLADRTTEVQQPFTNQQMSQIAQDAWREISSLPQTVSNAARQLTNEGFLNVPPLFDEAHASSGNRATSERGGNSVEHSRNGSVSGAQNSANDSGSLGADGRFGGRPTPNNRPANPAISDCPPPKPGVKPVKPTLPGADTPDPCDGPEKIRCTPVKPDSVKPVKPEGGQKPEISDNAEIKKDVLKELSQLDGYESLTDQQLKQLFNDLYIDAMENRKK